MCGIVEEPTSPAMTFCLKYLVRVRVWVGVRVRVSPSAPMGLLRSRKAAGSLRSSVALV